MKVCQPVALVDVDDVLADTKSVMHRIFKDVYNAHTHWSRWRSFDTRESVGIEFCPETFRREGLIERVQPLKGAQNFLHCLKQYFHVVIVTARGWHPDGERITRDWLRHHELPHDAIHIVPMDVSKKMVAIQYGERLSLVVDDNVDHIRDYLTVPAVKRAIMVNQPWNASFESNDERLQRVNELSLFKFDKPEYVALAEAEL